MSSSVFAQRLLEQAEPWTPWYRRSWEPGTILRLREYSEALRLVVEGSLRTGATKQIRDDLRPLLGRDRGLFVGEAQRQLDQILQRDITNGTSLHHRLDHLIAFVDEGYLERWHQAVATGAFELERASRYISGHLLDSGFHSSTVRELVQAAVRDSASDEELVSRLLSLSQTASRSHRGIVPMTHIPETDQMERLKEYLAPSVAAARMRTSGLDPGRDLRGALVLEVVARDRPSAAVQIHERMERLVSRTKLLRKGRPLEFLPIVLWDDGERSNLQPDHTAISLQSLTSTGVLYSADLGGDTGHRRSIDDALELATNLLGPHPGVATASGWAALEALLTPVGVEAGRGSEVSRSAGAIAAAAWPRAELTKLSYTLDASPATPRRLVAQLKSSGSNAERCDAIMRWLTSGQPIPDLSDARGQASLLRMNDLAHTPHATLRRVRAYHNGAFARLYRQRNIILHGGGSGSLALRASIRTAGPLVGATLDRLSHLYEDAGMTPHESATRAALAIDLLKQGDGWPLTHLLTD